jgi:hypothetical protein
MRHPTYKMTSPLISLEGGPPKWTMTSSDVNSGWRAPYVDKLQTFLGPPTVTMASPGVNSGWRALYLVSDQPFSEVWKEDLLPGQRPVLV